MSFLHEIPGFINHGEWVFYLALVVVVLGLIFGAVPRQLIDE
jgi:hypothetical protein